MLSRKWPQRPLAAVSLLMASVASACSGEPEPVDNLPRVAVSGTVTLDSNPLPAGKIQFQPVGTEPATMAVGEVQDGRYAIDRSAGPCPGKYRVMISSRTAPKTGEGQQPGGANLEKEKVPQQYNTRSTLEVEIAPEGPLTLDFPLTRRR